MLKLYFSLVEILDGMFPYLLMGDAAMVRDKTDIKPKNAVYSAPDVCIHNKPDDCWLIIRGRVYDVTSWLVFSFLCIRNSCFWYIN